MKVIKRDGRLQDFDLSKIKTSISRASDDADQPFNESDLYNLARDIENHIESLGNDSIKAEDIQQRVLEKLEKEGFQVVAKFYYEGK